MSVADPTKFATASVTITCSATNTISPPAATVSLAQTQTFSASFFLAAGAAITWDVNGIAGGNSAIGTTAPSSTSTARYTAPIDLPSPAAVAATLGGWSCNAATQQLQFDGSYAIQRLPINHNYKIYAEPLEGLVTPSNLSDPLASLCGPPSAPSCTTPAANTNFNVRTRPASP